MDERFIHPICQKWNFSTSVFYAIVGSSLRLHLSRPLRPRVYAREVLESMGCFQSKDLLDLTTDQADATQLNVNSALSAKTSSAKSDNENERRRKIGLANKGNVPWNKGRKHSAGISVLSSAIKLIK